MIVYLVRNKINGKLYVGQTIESLQKRWCQHYSNNPKTVVDRAIRKYGKDAFAVSQIARASNKEQLDYLEQYFIVVYNSHISYGMGYNVDHGGGGSSGRVVSEETRKKLSAWQKGCKKSESHRLAIGVASKNRFRNGMPIEHRLKISAALKGKPCSRLGIKNSPQAVENQRIAQRKRWQEKGGHHSEEVRNKIRTAHKLRPLRNRCKSGAHEFTPENTLIVTNGTRVCKACLRGWFQKRGINRFRVKP